MFRRAKREDEEVVVRDVPASLWRLVKHVRTIFLWFFVINLTISVALAVYVKTSNDNRSHVFAKVVDKINDNTAATNTAAASARSAAQKASSDLAAAIAHTNSPNPQLIKAFAEIDCIAKGQVPCKVADG